MKRLLALAALLVPASLPALVASCSESEAKENVEKLKTELGGRVDQLVDELAADLDRIQDEASARELREKVQPVLDQLVALKERMMGELPDAERIRRLADDLKQRFPEKSEVRAALRPVLEKLEELTR